jgi:hypothetical protein
MKTMQKLGGQSGLADLKTCLYTNTLQDAYYSTDFNELSDHTCNT